jgi:hypothetical protein
MRTRSLRKITFSAVAVIATFSVSSSAVGQGNGMRSNGFGTAVHGVPPSVTSFGFGGRPGFHGVPPSVTSLNFGNSPFRTHQGSFLAPHRRRNRGLVSPFHGGIVAVPYYYPDYGMDPGVDDSMEEDYRGGPTIFDRRGPDTSEYPRPEQNRDEEDFRAAAPAEPARQVEAANQPRTVLVFKDGRRLEILNYAIAGSTLYDLSNGLTRKVALAELDLPATVKQNDDRGVDFQLPAAMKFN